MKKTLFLSSAVLLVLGLAAVGIHAIVSTAPETTPVEWHIPEGYLLDRDGSVIGTAAITLRGEIRDYEDREDCLALSFEFPESFPYSTDFQDPPVYTVFHSGTAGWPYHSADGFCFIKATDTAAKFSFAIDPERGLILMQFGDGPEHFFVASRNATATPADILQHFQSFLGSDNPFGTQ